MNPEYAPVGAQSLVKKNHKQYFGQNKVGLWTISCYNSG